MYSRTQQQRLQQQWLQQRLQQQLLSQHSSDKENLSQAANSMVCLQSQWRGGSINNCKKRASKLNIRTKCTSIAAQNKKNNKYHAN
jgi:hypothetical protein